MGSIATARPAARNPDNFEPVRAARSGRALVLTTRAPGALNASVPYGFRSLARLRLSIGPSLAQCPRDRHIRRTTSPSEAEGPSRSNARGVRSLTSVPVLPPLLSSRPFRYLHRRTSNPRPRLFLEPPQFGSLLPGNRELLPFLDPESAPMRHSA